MTAVADQWLSDHWLAVVLLVAYTALLLYNAQIGRRRSKNIADYYVGGRNFGGVAIGFSFFATYASTNSYIGNAGQSYAYGAPWMLLAGFMVLFTILSWSIVAPKLRRFAASWDALTLPDYLAARFPSENQRLRLLAAAVVVFSSLLYLIAIFKGAGHLFELFFGISYTSAVGLTLLIVVLYTSVGGFHSVVRTDVMQGVLMLLGSVTLFYFVTRAAGGVTAIADLKSDVATAPLFSFGAGVPLAVLLGISLSGSLKLLVDPRQLSRFYALKDEQSIRQGRWVATVGIAVIMVCLFPIGLFSHLLVDNVQDTDLIVPTLVNDPAIFPIWVADFLVVAIVAAAMSSMDSVLLVAASVLYKDIVATLSPGKRPLVWTRGGVVGFAIVAAGIALDPPGGIVEITIFSGSLYAVCFLPALLFGLHWIRGSAIAVIGSMVLGTVVLVGWLAAGWREIAHELFPALLVSTSVYLLLSRWTPNAILQWPDTQTPEKA